MACISRFATAILSCETELALGTIRVKVNLKAVGYDARNWMDLAQDRDQWWAYIRAVMNTQVP